MKTSRQVREKVVEKFKALIKGYKITSSVLNTWWSTISFINWIKETVQSLQLQTEPHNILNCTTGQQSL